MAAPRLAPVRSNEPASEHTPCAAMLLSLAILHCFCLVQQRRTWACGRSHDACWCHGLHAKEGFLVLQCSALSSDASTCGSVQATTFSPKAFHMSGPQGSKQEPRSMLWASLELCTGRGISFPTSSSDISPSQRTGQEPTSILCASSKISTEFSHLVCRPPRILPSTR